MSDCYYGHNASTAEQFSCFDGKSTVCPQCCLASCRARTPDWFARCRQAGHPTWPAAVRAQAAELPPELPRKIVCLETNWGDHKGRLFHNTSVRPFLESLGHHFDPPLRLAHRYTESVAQLAYYVAYPDGLLWRDREAFDAPVFYLSFHGAPARLRSTLGEVDAEALCSSFAGWGEKYPNLVYFGACSVFAGEEGAAFARRFLDASGCRAVLGYTTDIDWMDSMVTDLLFLRRFFMHDDPWNNLRAIHDSVLADFAPAVRLGFTLVLR